MARARQDTDIEDAYRLVSDVLAGAVRETLAAPGPDPARFAVRQLTANDEETSDDSPPPGWSLAFLVLADWYDAARETLADRPDRGERALGWVEQQLGRRFAARARYTVTPLVDPASALETSHYVDALGPDFLPTMVWTVAGLVAEFPADDDPLEIWPRTRADARR
ncbi:hypothetical protein [Pseudonocardia sp. HH130630-07]|uniref:hypothetical protein n=1 Tax=Pseudonocardia sp. HH130630-07 TaxID=1690815 RepID=UPI000814BEB4|nr:hypothetical protein [Pseudonocardia sp. HH130630-07]ANY08406.1 hypothetical protein AFB00_21395 [Pseudonocardia sp. HH130630-07]